MKKILIIQGHPYEGSFNTGLSEAYKKGAINAGAEVREIIIRDLNFNPNLESGYTKRTELEPDLLEAQKALKWAEHIVVIFPVWWGSVPAILKGFFDRILLPGFAFSYQENSSFPKKHFENVTGRIIYTCDQPYWYYRFINGRPTHGMMKKMVLNFIGVNPVKSTHISTVRNSSEAFRTKWLQKIEQLGTRMA